jgi:hypothetical protein
VCAVRACGIVDFPHGVPAIARELRAARGEEEDAPADDWRTAPCGSGTH